MELKRLGRGFVWGMVATLAMTVLMVLGIWTGVSPMPKPIPPAIMAKWAVFWSPTVALIWAVAAHFCYGGFWAGLMSVTFDRITVWHGLALGIGLWLFAGITWLPWLGWGVFGDGASAAVTLATLGLHLVYGLVFGLTMDHGAERHSGMSGAVAHPAH